MKHVPVAAALAVAILSAVPAQGSLVANVPAVGAALAAADDEPPCNYIRVRCPHK